MNAIPTTEERIWAVISHLSSLAFGMGIVLPIVGWADQRRKSNYASFQTLQALGYQSLGFTVWILSYLVLVMIATLLLLSTIEPATPSIQRPLQQPAFIFFFIVVLGFLAIYFLLPIVAAIACGLGKDFRYPIMGDRLARYLGHDLAEQSDENTWLDEDHEIRWMAAMGHFSILILIWGMLAPLTAWMLYGRHSLFLKFQSAQTLIYQAITTVLYFFALFIYLFGFALLLAGTGGIGTPNLDSPSAIAALVAFGVAALLSLVLILLIPLLHVLGQWAGYRVLKGDDYRYPLVARLVDRWIAKDSTMEEKNT